MRQEALNRFETRAARLPALMTVPMIVFILPCVFLIVAGPAVVHRCRQSEGRSGAMKWIMILAGLLLLTACAGHDRSQPNIARSDLRVANAALAGGMPETALTVTRDSATIHATPRRCSAKRRGADRGRPDAAGVPRACWRSNGRSSVAVLGLGRASLAMGQVHEAEITFRKAIDMTPTDAAAKNNLGIALDLQDRHDEAQAAYRAALAQRPTMTAAQVNLGLSLALAGSSESALNILRPLAADPDADGRVRQDLAVALALAGDEAEAGRLLLRDLPPDKVTAALARYAALKAPAK
jgi:Flp pilus assembly protein TadD